MLSQIGTATGMFLFVPLGDNRERRSLITLLLLAAFRLALRYGDARRISCGFNSPALRSAQRLPRFTSSCRWPRNWPRKQGAAGWSGRCSADCCSASFWRAPSAGFAAATLRMACGVRNRRHRDADSRAPAAHAPAGVSAATSIVLVRADPIDRPIGAGASGRCGNRRCWARRCSAPSALSGQRWCFCCRRRHITMARRSPACSDWSGAAGALCAPFRRTPYRSPRPAVYDPVSARAHARVVRSSGRLGKMLVGLVIGVILLDLEYRPATSPTRRAFTRSIPPPADA